MPRLIVSAVMAALLIAVFAPAGGSIPAAAQAPEVEVAAVAGTVIVDELSDGFRQVGSGWRSATGGYDGHHDWVPASRKLTRVGIWTATLGEAGLYQVLAKLPAVHASSRQAVYKLKTASGWETQVRSQAAYRGHWVNLGTYAFSAQAEVRLTDKTLDARGSRLMLAFDALKFIPIDPPDPPVITLLDVEPRHDRAIVTFSLAEAGPAKTEYREAGTSAWTVGSNEQSSKYADHRQVITGLRPETDYELRVTATNLGGETVSPITSFTTLAPPPPVISNVVVKPEDTRVVVTFRLDAKGPAQAEYREPGDATWVLGAEDTSSNYKDHRQVIRGLDPETAYELRVIATNAGGRTVSDTVRFSTLARRVNCGAGEDFAQALSQAKSGDTIIIRGTCTGNFDAGWWDGRLTLRGDGGTLVGAAGSADPVLTMHGATSVRSLVIAGGEFVGLRNDQGDLTVIDSTIRGNGWAGVQTDGGYLSMRGSTVLANGGPGLVAGGFAGGGSVDISESTIRDNDGAGIWNGYETRVADSVISGNGGAGIENVSNLAGHSLTTVVSSGPSPAFRGVLTVVRSTIADNGASGLVNSYDAEVRSSTIQGNRTTGVGGGIHNVSLAGYFRSGHVVVIGSTLTGNRATDGGGIYNGPEATMIVENSVIKDNIPNDCVGAGCP